MRLWYNRLKPTYMLRIQIALDVFVLNSPEQSYHCPIASWYSTVELGDILARKSHFYRCLMRLWARLTAKRPPPSRRLPKGVMQLSSMGTRCLKCHRKSDSARTTIIKYLTQTHSEDDPLGEFSIFLWIFHPQARLKRWVFVWVRVRWGETRQNRLGVLIRGMLDGVGEEGKGNGREMIKATRETYKTTTRQF